jgi:hypothetical protein
LAATGFLAAAATGAAALAGAGAGTATALTVLVAFIGVAASFSVAFGAVTTGVFFVATVAGLDAEALVLSGVAVGSAVFFTASLL